MRIEVFSGEDVTDVVDNVNVRSHEITHKEKGYVLDISLLVSSTTELGQIIPCYTACLLYRSEGDFNCLTTSGQHG